MIVAAANCRHRPGFPDVAGSFRGFPGYRLPAVAEVFAITSRGRYLSRGSEAHADTANAPAAGCLLPAAADRRKAAPS